MPSFRSSCYIPATSETNFEKTKGTSNHMILVPLVDLKSLTGSCGKWCRDFKSAALVYAALTILRIFASFANSVGLAATLLSLSTDKETRQSLSVRARLQTRTYRSQIDVFGQCRLEAHANCSVLRGGYCWQEQRASLMLVPIKSARRKKQNGLFIV